MDVLSQILSSIQLGSPLLTDLRLGGGTRLDMGDAMEQPAPGVPFYYAVAGSSAVTTAERMSVVLSPGDFLLFPHWDRHFISAGTVTSDVHILEIISDRRLPLWSSDDDFPGVLQLEIGSPAAARLLCGIFAIEPGTARRLFGDQNRVVQLNAREADMHDALRLGLELICERHDPSVPGFSAVLSKCLELIFVQSVRHWLLHAGRSPLWVGALSDDRLRRAIEAIHLQPDRNWHLSELARISGQSRSRFAEHFRRSLAQTPFEYIKRCRNHSALRLLARRELSIETIAEQVGYASATTFARNFAREFGVSPKQYRRRIAS